MQSVTKYFALAGVCASLLVAGLTCDRSSEEGKPPGRAVGPSEPAVREEKQSEQKQSASEQRTKEGQTPAEFQERRPERLDMVKHQIKRRGVTKEGVLEAMRQVPRHLFVPQGQRNAAYADNARPIGEGQTISQPYIVAYMTEKLQLEPGDRVLEVGTGSGYQAAVLAELTSEVYTIEILETLGRTARQRLDGLGYDQVKVKIGDGYFGWKEYAPFDAIIVTCAAGHVPPPLKEQLKKGGRMLIPVGGPFWTQRLMLITRNEEGDFESEDLLPVRFVPMTGEAQD